MGAAAWSPASFREVTHDLDPRVLAAGPPPLPGPSAAWRFRVADPANGDAELIADWMARPHVDRFWEQAWPAERWAAVLRRQLDGDCTRPLVAARDGLDLAYLEVYRTPRDVVGRHYPARPHDLGIHVAIGPREATGRGVGRELVRSLAHALFDADRACTRIVADPDVRHDIARRMFARAGFRPLSEVDLGHKNAVLMSYERPPLPR
ncbi:GNAT family N-acetyltransferase [Micromonospora sp. WMMD1076]|uniref:GNAT family N-acetyltransferase n=1 Tax=Micromonospora TaxID=1873 RepID=UPI00249B4586|nr:GNAT family N-acetyltransferase [Micromonospora sp. WMMD1076]WFF04671.1 GNAT family N-acetyltransferase [Micromonospora sp. WMMD1076]